VPADNKAFMRYKVAEIVRNSLNHLEIDFPKLGDERSKGLEAVRQALRD
jgi:hypothetical protein